MSLVMRDSHGLVHGAEQLFLDTQATFVEIIEYPKHERY